MTSVKEIKKVLRRCHDAISGYGSLESLSLEYFFEIIGQAFEKVDKRFLPITGQAFDSASKTLLLKVLKHARRIEMLDLRLSPRILDLISQDELVEILKCVWKPVIAVNGPVSPDVMTKFIDRFLGKPDLDLISSRLFQMESIELSESIKFSEKMEKFRTDLSKMVKEKAVRPVDVLGGDSWDHVLDKAFMLNFLLNDGKFVLYKKEGDILVSRNTNKKTSNRFSSKIWIITRKEKGFDLTLA